jgi:branched-chain amino acid transport system substrate-binding protein
VEAAVRHKAIIILCVHRPAALLLWVATSLLATHTFLAAQISSKPAEPYAAIDREAIDYAGPGRDAEHDLPGNEIKIGLILPLSGARKAEGEALLTASQMALEDEALTPSSHGLRLTLVPRDENGLWGRASSEIVKLVVDDRAIALITSPDGRAAHLAEQVGNRLGVPVLSLASDSQNTRINIPWYFRMVPDDAAQARLFAHDIYRRRSFRNVVVVFEADHDGKVGREEFSKAVRSLEARAPVEVALESSSTDLAAAAARINDIGPQAVVLWTCAEIAVRVLTNLRDDHSAATVYVCHKALQEPFVAAAREANVPRIWTARAAADPVHLVDEFDRRFRERTGTGPTPAARAMYDAVRLVAAGVRIAGPNRARLRDRLAKVEKYRGVSGLISFDGAGNNRAQAVLIQLD